jgi:hypothetical protein
MARPARTAAIEIKLDVRFSQWQARWAAVYDAAQCPPVALPERRDYKIATNTIAGHSSTPLNLL